MTDLNKKILQPAMFDAHLLTTVYYIYICLMR